MNRPLPLSEKTKGSPSHENSTRNLPRLGKVGQVLPLLFLIVVALLFFSAVSPPYLKTEIEITVDDEAPRKAEVTTDLSHALRAERAGGYEALYEALLAKYDAKDALNYLGIGLGDYLSAQCEIHKTDPLDATLKWTENLSCPFIYYADRAGRAIDPVEAGRALARALDKGKGARARLCTHEVAAEVTEKDLRQRTAEMARFGTGFETSGQNRRHNLTLAAKWICGRVIAPGESFSFNDAVGARTEERGFREANVVINGEFVKGVGGGVCQVSTTLYNAVLLAGLPVKNAAAHSRPVSYVPYSRDCTVSSSIDFLFENDTPYPVYLAAQVKDSTLTFVLYGKKKEGRRRVESEVVEEIPFRDLYEDGIEVKDPANATLLSAGRTGIKSRLYLIREENGTVTRTLIRENLYPPKNATYKRKE